MKKKSKTYYLMVKGYKISEKKKSFNHLKSESKTIGMGLWLKGKGIQKRIKGIK